MSAVRRKAEQTKQTIIYVHIGEYMPESPIHEISRFSWRSELCSRPFGGFLKSRLMNKHPVGVA